MLKVLIIIGTRPEAIKLAPIVLELQKHPKHFESLVCLTAQHRKMLDQMIEWFQIKVDVDLGLMQQGQSLAKFASRALEAVSYVLEDIQPDVVLVQGDTTTVMMAALAAFYQRIPVGHVEAGLRTRDPYNPFPEEINRRVAGVLATYHFAPTDRAAAALKAEQVPTERIFITGNTVVDALLWTIKKPVYLPFTTDSPRMILVTAHRRESFGAAFDSLCWAIRDLAERNPEVEVVYPVHLNPNVRESVGRILDGRPRIHLLDPLRYEQFCHLMKRSYFILTDSGGIQEEAPVICKPVLVMRETTERQEALEAGAALLVGTDRERIVSEAEKLLNDDRVYQRMAQVGSLYGDGCAAERIVKILLHQFGRSMA
jgi:UDP-N-acetylglucosamine 2-epimerase